jgi:hypothetical protein
MNGSAASSTPAPQKYWLARHVYLCTIPSGVVLLDLRKDKYLGLGGQALYRLGEIVHGWPAAPERATGLTREQVLATAEKLLAAGLLTRDACAGKSAAPVCLEQIAMSRIEPPERAPRIRFGDITVFLIAWIRAAVDLRWRTLETVVDQVNARKQRALQRGARPDAKKAAELAVIFARLRAYVYTRSDRCLFDSLAFIHFMARHGQFPLWVLGVRSHPFGAHSWVQQDNVVLDDSPDRVYDYTPILAV